MQPPKQQEFIIECLGDGKWHKVLHHGCKTAYEARLYVEMANENRGSARYRWGYV